ncbi:MAG: 5-formyltetrahydrofolate cyclo-ligase, partial [Actinomycetota bacterium]|nr:5-formyltetrahydrofolate cyclo-ligase [Actinomycetota bacterium]
MRDAGDDATPATSGFATGARAEKQRLRREFGATRRARTAPELAAARAAICALVLAVASDWACVAAYEPLPTEPGSKELLAGLIELGARVLVPVTLPDRNLDWVQWGSPVREPLGVDAVHAAATVLVPALAVAADGTRLGRGGGSYDRALAGCAVGTTLVALLFNGELINTLPVEPWDRPVT